MSLARQGVSFRIIGKSQYLGLGLEISSNLNHHIDKADTSLKIGRANGVHPRFLETAGMWGVAQEIAEEGPLIDRTAIYKDGQKLLFNQSHQSDSRYKGLHIITQAQIEKIYVRDLLRHRSIVERSCSIEDYTLDHAKSHPVKATVRNGRTGISEEIQAKFLVGSDGASSMIRKRLGIPFDGVSTGIYWGIMDCIFESDYPHAWIFG